MFEIINNIIKQFNIASMSNFIKLNVLYNSYLLQQEAFIVIFVIPTFSIVKF